MKIKILKNNEFCFAKYDGLNFTVDNCCIDDCTHLDPISDALIRAGHNCSALQESVKAGEYFFLKKVFYPSRSIEVESIYTGRFINDGGGLKLELDRFISGEKIRHRKDDIVLIKSFQPNNISFLQSQRRSVMTSDCILTLDDDEFLTVVNGSIDKITKQELLKLLSKEKVESSPSYKKLQLTPQNSRPQRPRKGTVIFNDFSKKLEYYDGNEWKTLKAEG